jgi:hypothetical protein
MAIGIRHADHVAPSTRKVSTNFADKRRALDRYSYLEVSGNEWSFLLFVGFFLTGYVNFDN